MKNLILVAFALVVFISCKEEKKTTDTEVEVKTEINTTPSSVTENALATKTVSPKFVDYENYDGTKTSLDDLKGKYVYVDVWATWCPPCRKEIPHLQKVEKKYHNKNIAFVSISLDKESDKAKWKKMIADKKMTGIQLFAGKDVTFTKGYNIRGIPRFILIDTEGNIANANAPRPSDAKGIEKLFSEI